jgi:uncharacterized membrane protein (DUF485 family)
VSGSTVGAGGRFTRKEGEGATDWRAVEALPEFQELVRARRSFLIPATIVFIVGAIGYLLLAAFDHGLMGKQVLGGIPFAWLAALTQVLLTWVLTWAYLRKADSTFEPLEERAAEAAARAMGGSGR